MPMSISDEPRRMIVLPFGSCSFVPLTRSAGRPPDPLPPPPAPPPAPPVAALPALPVVPAMPVVPAAPVASDPELPHADRRKAARQARVEAARTLVDNLIAGARLQTRFQPIST